MTSPNAPTRGARLLPLHTGSGLANAAMRLAAVRLFYDYWQHEDVTVPETGEALPKGTMCFLTVPVNKTSRSFPKAINRLVGTRIADWEREHPGSPAIGCKTG